LGRLGSGCLGVSLIATYASAAVPPDLTGNWMRADGGARIEISRCGTKLCATNTWVRDTNGGEAPGDKIVMTLEQQSDAVLNGEAFDQKRDRTYAMRISIPQAGRMTTRGCVLIGMVCKTIDWTRTQ
jgi:uncharacterized protein (DUF2147 family)